MELPGETYLFNISLIAITFTAVSALVMLMRHSMGGKLTNFDIFLLTTYISFGFVQSLAAVIPSLVALYKLPEDLHWAISSGLSAIMLGIALANAMRVRKAASTLSPSLGVKFSFGIHGFAVLLLVFNAVMWPWQGIHLFATAITVSVAVTMWAFVRRIASLLGDKPGEDWDPKRG